ncbi:hypothetical protein HK101_002781 [Irineochytrium annulatum]|nr:hypothetical protein HK101_002781 [Irineochytrium annulatum]
MWMLGQVPVQPLQFGVGGTGSAASLGLEGVGEWIKALGAGLAAASPISPGMSGGGGAYGIEGMMMATDDPFLGLLVDV